MIQLYINNSYEVGSVVRFTPREDDVECIGTIVAYYKGLYEIEVKDMLDTAPHNYTGDTVTAYSDTIYEEV